MTQSIYNDKILILDFGSQYTQLIARRIREIGVYCEIWPWDVSEELINEFSPKGVILSGGPESVLDSGAPSIPKFLLSGNMPVLGICYGMQSMMHQLGGSVEAASEREFGYAKVEIVKSNLLVDDMDDGDAEQPMLDVWMSHGDRVSSLAAGFEVVGTTKNCPFAIVSHETLALYGMQFHPEVTHTRQGKKILRQFVLEICKCEALWTAQSIIESSITRIQNQVGSDKVILGLSGGVDSSVTALLLHQAIGAQLTCVFIDNGLLRLNEAQQVMEMFGDQFGLNIVHLNAQDQFLNALAQESDPEKKRKVIGHTFIKIFDDQATKIQDVNWLAQGTIYPDVIESAASKTGKAHVIKSHHNVGGLPEDMQLGLVEPLRDLFKDEVRKVGLALGLPHQMLYRHPFPGPGLGVRVLGEVKKEYCDILRQADAIFIEELYQANLYHEVSQAFAVFLPVRSVGVMGDGRKYDWVIALRAVETIDFMTARWAHLPYDFLDRVSSRIVNEIDGVSRVVYDISGKPPATIEWE